MPYFPITLKADNINIMHTPFASVSPYSIYQFIKAFKCRMMEDASYICEEDSEGVSINIDGFAVIQHSLFVYKGKKGPFTSLSYGQADVVSDKKIDDAIIAGSLPIELLASGEFTIVLDLDLEDIDYYNFIKQAKIKLNKMKFIGGVLSSLEINTLFHNEDSLKEYLRSNIGYGMFYVSDNKSTRNRMENDNMSPAEAIIWSTYPIYSDDKKLKRLLNDPLPGFRFPSLVGYQLLEKPKYREGTRSDNRKHAYAEPIYSVVNRMWTTTYIHSNKTLSDLGFLWRRKEHASSLSVYVESF